MTTMNDMRQLGLDRRTVLKYGALGALGLVTGALSGCSSGGLGHHALASFLRGRWTVSTEYGSFVIEVDADRWTVVDPGADESGNPPYSFITDAGGGTWKVTDGTLSVTGINSPTAVTGLPASVRDGYSSTVHVAYRDDHPSVQVSWDAASKTLHIDGPAERATAVKA